MCMYCLKKKKMFGYYPEHLEFGSLFQREDSILTVLHYQNNIVHK